MKNRSRAVDPCVVSCFERWTRVASGRGRGVLGAGRGVQRGDSRGSVGLGRERELHAGGGGHLQEEGLVGLDQDPALGVPNLETEVGRRRGGEDGRHEEVVLVRVVQRLLEQFTRGLTAEHVLEGQARVLPASTTQVVDEVLEGLADGGLDVHPDLGAEGLEGLGGHLAGPARGEESDRDHGVDRRILQRVAQEARARARMHAVEVDAEDVEPVDVRLALIELAELGVADLAGETPDGDLDRVPPLLQTEDLFERLRSLEDDGLARPRQRHGLSTQASDDPVVALRRIQGREVAGLPDGGETLGGAVATRLQGQETHGPTEVAGDLTDLLPGLPGILFGEPIDDAVVQRDVLALCQAQGDSSDATVLFAGLRVEVADEQAVHGLPSADVPGLVDVHVGDQAPALVAHLDGPDVHLHALAGVLGVGQFALAHDRDVVVGRERHEGSAVFSELGSAVSQHLGERASHAHPLSTEDDLGDEGNTRGAGGRDDVTLDHLPTLAVAQRPLPDLVEEVRGDLDDVVHDACDDGHLLRDCQRGGLGGFGHGTLLGVMQGPLGCGMQGGC